MTEIIAGLILGLTGSLHCIGMCGPIAVSLPVISGNKMKFILRRLLYNSGRITTYVLLGAVFGLIGSRIKLAGLQQFLSVFTGAVILIGVFVSYGSISRLFRFNFAEKAFIKFKDLFGFFLTKKSSAAFFTIGFLNGFLPCGLVYLAISGALLTGDVFSGSVFMLMFGLGTVPLMLAVSVAGRRIHSGFSPIKKLIPVLTICLAILFILRGLNLGIPYISPKLIETNAEKGEVICN